MKLVPSTDVMFKLFYNLVNFPAHRVHFHPEEILFVSSFPHSQTHAHSLSLVTSLPSPQSPLAFSLSPIEGTDSKDLPDDIQARCRSVGRFVSRVLAVPSVGGGLRFYPGGTPCGPTHDGGPDCGFECGCVSVCWCVAGGHRFRNPWSAIAGA